MHAENKHTEKKKQKKDRDKKAAQEIKKGLYQVARESRYKLNRHARPLRSYHFNELIVRKKNKKTLPTATPIRYDLLSHLNERALPNPFGDKTDTTNNRRVLIATNPPFR